MFQHLFGKESPFLSFYHNICDYGNGLQKRCENINKFSIALLNYINIDFPNERNETEKLLDIYDRVIDNESKMKEAVMRFAEDFRDIYERQKVIDHMTDTQERHFAEHMQIKEVYEKNKNNPEFKKNYPHARDDLIKMREDLKQEINHVIEQREKFTKFVVNRLKHGFSVYATALEESGINQSIIYKQISERLAGYSKERNVRILEQKQENTQNGTTQ